MQEGGRERRITHDKFDDVEGGSIGTKGRDAKIEATSKELFGLLLTLWWEIRIHTSATMHRYSPTAHYYSLYFYLLCFAPVYCFVLCVDFEEAGWCFYRQIQT